MPPTSGTLIDGPVGATVQPASSSPASATGRMITTAATLTPELILPGWCLWRYARRRSPRRQDVFTDSGRDVLTMGGNNVQEITSVLDHSRSAVLRVYRLGPGVARRPGQRTGRRSVQQLPPLPRPPRWRIHAPGMAHRHADDDQSRRGNSTGPTRDHDGVLDQELPRKSEARRGGDPRAGQSLDEGVGGAHAWVAAARSVGHERRSALVHGPDEQCAWPGRSEDRQDQGIFAQDASLRTSWSG